MKLMAALGLACGFSAAPLTAAGPASALPGTCDGAGCVPYVDHNITPSAPCAFQSRYPFGLDASGATYLCASTNRWLPTEPLIGVRTVRASCDESRSGSAQSPDGQALVCENQGWSASYTELYFPSESQSYTSDPTAA